MITSEGQGLHTYTLTIMYTDYHVLSVTSLCMNVLFLCSALSAGGTRVLNANSPYRRRSNVRASGVQWKYRRNSARERLSASGTLTQAAVVEVLVGRNGSSVRFTYKYEVAASTTGMPTPRLSWAAFTPSWRGHRSTYIDILVTVTLVTVAMQPFGCKEWQPS